MRWVAPLIVCALAGAAAAQTAPPPVPVTATPLAPPPGAAVSPPLSPVPAAPAPQAPPPTNGAPAPAAAAAPPADQPAPLSDAWLPRQAAEIQALDKVNARSTVLTVPVGKSATYGSLTITVQACVVRPPDQPQDSAAYLVIADSHADEPGFSGWMMQDSPSLAMLQHPIYDIRVVGCRT